MPLSAFMSYIIAFMGVFFIAVSILKFLDWKGFANAFVMYDILAKKSKAYAYLYPIIELALGLAFLFKYNLKITAATTLTLMIVGSIGVTDNLFFSKQKVHCACLGTLIKIPLTKFTLFEDILMGIMALMVLIFV